jgi:hypothetical protein
MEDLLVKQPVTAVGMSSVRAMTVRDIRQPFSKLVCVVLRPKVPQVIVVDLSL